MNAKTVFSCAVILAVLGTGLARAEETLPAPSEDAPKPIAAPRSVAPMAGYPAPPGLPATAEALPPTGPQPAHGLSNWILYQRPDCCGPIGGDGPINTELYLRVGPSIPVGGRVFNHVLQTGWDIQGGGRSLFFNPTMDRDWAVDISVSNIYNHGTHTDFRIPVMTPPGTTTIRQLNRTFGNLGLGRDWYVLGPANACDCKWRWGIDVGGRYGTARCDFNAFPHRTDVIGGAYAALHTELEHTCGCCTFQYGFRAEWDYTSSDILFITRHVNSDLFEVNLLLTAGVRF
jgi:hypothetical protein